MIPLATTTITVLRAPAGDDDAEPYSGRTPDEWDEVATVRAVIDPGAGREQIAGGEQGISDLDLTCDLVDLNRLDQVRDDSTGITYRVVWLMTYPGEHIEAGLRLVEGDI